MKLVELQAIALQHKDNCPGNSGYEMCDDNDYRCCPKDLPVCCTIGLKPWEFCCPNNYTCCGEGYCCGGHNNSTTIEPVTQKTLYQICTETDANSSGWEAVQLRQMMMASWGSSTQLIQPIVDSSAWVLRTWSAILSCSSLMTCKTQMAKESARCGVTQ